MKKNKLFKKLFRKKMTLGQAILFLIVGAILGTVFTFGQQYWDAPIDREDAISVEAEYHSYSRKFLHPESHDVGIECKTENPYYVKYYIDASCVTYDILDYVHNLERGTNLLMLIHPNSDTILSLTVNGEEILNFDEVQDNLDSTNVGFLCLGLFMYVLAVCGAVRIIVIAVRKLNKSNKKRVDKSTPMCYNNNGEHR